MAALDARVCERARLARDARFGTSATVTRALRLITEGVLQAENVTRLAQRLGVSARHLNRLFRAHLGSRGSLENGSPFRALRTRLSPRIAAG